MADVRALLRAEMASRRTTQPSKKARIAAQPAATKKRKADADSEPEAKRAKSSIDAKGVPAGFFDEGAEAAATVLELDGEQSITPETAAQEGKATQKDAAALESPQEGVTESVAAQSSLPAGFFDDYSKQPAGATTSAVTVTDDVDDEEWAAFQRDVATPPPESSINILQTGPVISAPAMTVDEEAAQAREDQSIQRGRREAELEDEKEEAERHLVEEFEEMEELEKRVQRLREKREALKRANGPAAEATPPIEEPPVSLRADEQIEASSDEDDDEERFDDWRFGAA